MRYCVAGLLLLLLLAVFRPGKAFAQRITLAERGRSSYSICIAAAASESERLAAQEFQALFLQMTGVQLPIIGDDAPLGPNEIILGFNRHAAEAAKLSRQEDLGEDGFVIRTAPPHLIIAGGSGNGTLYGVYALFEEHLGCRWFAADAEIVPQRETVEIDDIDDRQTPAFAFREVYYQHLMEPRLAARLRLNGNASEVKDGRLVAEHHRDWGLWCHSLFTLVPPDVYYKAHPEYFSLVNGKRVNEKQLCLSNCEVFELAVSRLRGLMAANNARYWSVSQMDTAGACECPACRAIDEREGTPMGSMLEFVNRTAESFPQKVISTLAYQYTRKPPQDLRPRENVLINLCSIECNRAVPIADDADGSFREDIAQWAAICGNLFVWDYVVQFSNLVSPFPNLHVLQPDMQYFAKNNVRGVFSQGNRELGGEFCELRGYLLAKLQWNPNCDLHQHVNDFLQGYYGPAADHIRAYIDTMRQALAQSGKRLDIFGKPQDHADGYLAPERLAEYDQLFDHAEAAVADSPGLLARVRRARLPLQYAKLELKAGTMDERRDTATQFLKTSGEAGVLMLNEWSLTLEAYQKQLKKDFGKQILPAL